MDAIVLRLDAAVRAVCPHISGVAVGRKGDRSTWRVDYLPEATSNEVAAAEGVLAAFNAAAPTFPPVISDRQFFQGLATIGEITPAEAEEAVGPGTIPAAMAALIDQLPEAERFAARMKIRGATQYDRYDDLTETFRQLYGWTPEQLDHLWAMCAGL